MTETPDTGLAATGSLDSASIAELFAMHNRGDIDGRRFRVEVAVREMSAKPFFVRFLEGYPVLPSRLRDFAERNYDRREQRKRQFAKA